MKLGGYYFRQSQITVPLRSGWEGKNWLARLLRDISVRRKMKGKRTGAIAAVMAGAPFRDRQSLTSRA
jgi:hypothetical protein